jgi:DNA-binding XRE family transcriptional regulator
MKDNQIKLIAVSKNRKQKSEVVSITKDGWVITKDGAFGDINEDCTVELKLGTFLKKLRKENDLTQQDVSNLFDISRCTYIACEQDKSEITLKQFLLFSYCVPKKLSHCIPKNIWSKIRK